MFAWVVEEMQTQQLGHDHTSKRQTSKDDSRSGRILTRANFQAANRHTTVVEFEVGITDWKVKDGGHYEQGFRSAGLQVED